MSEKIESKDKKKMLSWVYFIIFFLIISIGLALLSSTGIGQKNFNVQFVHPNNNNRDLPSSSVVYIWATWCTVCKTNLPIIEKNQGISEYFGFQFLSLEEGRDLDELKNYIQSKNLPFSVGLLNDEMIEHFKISGYPTTLFIDKNGKVVFKDTGIINPLSFTIRLLLLKILSS
jgi:thiol-disulfide isomerase/thioredoxin